MVYHGDAPSHQVMISFARWSLMHQNDFISIVEGFVESERKAFIEVFSFALTDSGSDKEFKEKFKGYSSKVLDSVIAKLP